MTAKFTITDTSKPVRNELPYMCRGRSVQGCIGEYVYEAEIYGCKSQFGIHESNIGKLRISDPATGERVVAYHMEWDVLPASEFVTEMVEALVEYYAR
jgi:hypothetical protein